MNAENEKQEAACLFGDLSSYRGRTGASDNAPQISVVLPMHNEEGAAARLITELVEALGGKRFEIIAVNDASTDATLEKLCEVGAKTPALRIISHGRNAGRSRAVRTGVLAACGFVIATLDGDGQNNPADLPILVDPLLDAGRDRRRSMIAGERVGRRDTASKKLASRIANKVRARLLRDGAADTGCGIKAFYRDAYLRLPYFDHCHRYLPALFKREGFEVEFRPVSHRAREFGSSKYTNLGRLLVAVRDIMGVMWLNHRARSPIEITEVFPGESCDMLEPLGEDGPLDGQEPIR